MFSNIFQKAALFGASTVAGVALTGTMMASSAQAATMSYTSNFSVTSNSLNSEIATGDFSFDKTELTGNDAGLFSYKLEEFNVSVGAFGFNESLTLDGVKASPSPFLALNQAFVPAKYQGILPSVLDGEDSNYVGDGDFGEENLTFTFGFDLGDDNFTADGLDFVFSEEDFGNIAASLSGIMDINIPLATTLASLVFGEGGTVNFTTTSTPVPQSSSNLASVPEPTSILGISIIGVGLTATRRKRASKKIKQKSAS